MKLTFRFKAMNGDKKMMDTEMTSNMESMAKRMMAKHGGDGKKMMDDPAMAKFSDSEKKTIIAKAKAMMADKNKV